jgi:hypothetical protein
MFCGAPLSAVMLHVFYALNERVYLWSHPQTAVQKALSSKEKILLKMMGQLATILNHLQLTLAMMLRCRKCRKSANKTFKDELSRQRALNLRSSQHFQVKNQASNADCTYKSDHCFLISLHHKLLSQRVAHTDSD